MGQSRLGAALGLNVLAILRTDSNQLAPNPDVFLQRGDRLFVQGRPDRLVELQGRQFIVLEEEHLEFTQLLSGDIKLAELAFSGQSSMPGNTLEQLDFRNRFGVVVLAVRRQDQLVRTRLEDLILHNDDILLVQGTSSQLEALGVHADFNISSPHDLKSYQLDQRLMSVRIPPDSLLIGKTLRESRLGDAFGLGVMGIIREGNTDLVPDPDGQLVANDLLLVKGHPDDLQILEGLQTLTFDDQVKPKLKELESEQVGLVDIVISPRSTLTGKSLRQIHFRDKFGLNVLAIWREGRAYRTNLRDMALRFGDALLLYGQHARLQVLGKEPDFLVLSEIGQERPRTNKAPLALGIMIAILIPVILDLIPIAIAVITGVILMVLTRCLTMEEAYQAIEWKAVFLIAGMLPLGIAMEQTGAAQFLAEGMVGLIGGYGPVAVMAGLFLLAAVASQVMPNPAVAVLLAPIAFNTASDLGISPYPLMMVIAISASAAFLSPVGHSANILVMGPGGYRFSDYTKVGVPLTLVVLLVSMLVVPIFWPF